MKIVGVRLTIACVVRQKSLKMAYGEMPKTTTFVVQVDTNEATGGIGQMVAPAPWYGESAEAITSDIDKYITPTILVAALRSSSSPFCTWMTWRLWPCGWKFPCRLMRPSQTCVVCTRSPFVELPKCFCFTSRSTSLEASCR